MGEEFLDGLSIDLENHLVYHNQQLILLSRQEFALLELLVRNEGQVVRLEKIYRTLWPEEDRISRQDNLKHYIYRLRHKIETDPAHPYHLQTVRGKGYRLVRD